MNNSWLQRLKSKHLQYVSVLIGNVKVTLDPKEL